MEGAVKRWTDKGVSRKKGDIVLIVIPQCLVLRLKQAITYHIY